MPDARQQNLIRTTYLSAGKTSVFKPVKDAVAAAVTKYNERLQQQGLAPIQLLGDSKTMEDLLSKLSSSYGHARLFIADEGVRVFQQLGQF